MRWQLWSNEGPVLINGQPRIIEQDETPPAVQGKGWWYSAIKEQEMTPVPYEAPMECSMVQARLALAKSGLLNAITEFMKNQSEEDQIRWEFGTVLRRDDPKLVEAAAGADILDQLPGLFELAVTL